MPGKRRIDRRVKVLEKMIALYCRSHHDRDDSLCPSCEGLFTYASGRLKTCRELESKRFCSSCTIHCYGEAERDAIRRIMRYSGPRMIFHHPVLALEHALQGWITSRNS